MRKITYKNDEMFYFNSDVRRLAVGSSRHYHNLFEIYYLKEGSCSYFIDNRVFEMKAGDVVLIPSGVIHKTNYLSGEHTRILIECSENMVPDLVKNSLSSMLYLYRNSPINKEFYNIYKRMEKEINK